MNSQKLFHKEIEIPTKPSSCTAKSRYLCGVWKELQELLQNSF